MTNCAFGLPTENWVRLGAVTASAEVIGLGPGNLQTDQGATSAAWQTPAGTTSAWLQVDAGEAVEWGAVGLFNTNQTALATMRVRLSDDATFTTSLADSGVLPGLVAVGYRQAVHVLPAPVTARYLRVDIADPVNPENLLRVAQAFGGKLRRPQRNFGYDSRVQRIADRAEVITRGGQKFYELRHARRAWALSLPSLAPAEVWPLVMELQRATESGGNLLFIPAPSGPDVAREAVFGPLLDPSPVAWPSQTPRLRAWSAIIEERL